MSTAQAISPPQSPTRALHISLWVVQGLLAAAFLMAGLMKLTTPIAELGQKMAWVQAVSPTLVRFIGLSEFLGALGLLLPSLTGIQPKLTALAAGGLVTVMILASGFHATRGEYGAIGFNLVLGGLAALVAWGRHKGAPIAARSKTS